MTLSQLEPSETLMNYAEVVTALHKNWTPHEGQIEAGKALFNDDIRKVFIQCGRKWGKTELAIYILWRWAQLNPGRGCYYVAPQLKQAREIVWADPRIKTFGPRNWLHDGDYGINNTEMRLRFKNGSFIKIDGSDNYDSHRGTRPGILVYEEYKDHRREFRQAMRPNLGVYNAPEIFIGTPPEDVDFNDADNEYVRTAIEHIEGKKSLYKKAPTWENPHIPQWWLDEEKERLIKRGDEHEWMREYAAEFCKGGASKIFPMIDRAMIKPHKGIIDELRRDLKKLEWFIIADPAAATVFGVLFMAVNPYSRQIYFLDEIYEDDQYEMTVQKIGRRIASKRHQINPYADWRKIYDEAATWWSSEMLDHFDEYWEPSQKAQNKKEVGIGLLKDIMLADKCTFSDRCVKLFWEMDNYRKDKHGRIPKKDDHLIDCVRYGLGSAGYHTVNQDEPLDPEKHEMWRGARIEDDFPEIFNEEQSIYEDWEP
jgi:hypothetical protein